MACMTKLGCLFIRFLQAVAAHNRAEGEMLSGCFPKQLEKPVWELADIPQRVSLIGDNNRITELQIDHGIHESQAEGDILRI